MRTDEEMQITLRTLQQDFGVDVAPAQGLSGADLATWRNRPGILFSRENTLSYAPKEHKWSTPNDRLWHIPRTPNSPGSPSGA